MPHGPHDIRVGQDAEGRFAIQMRLRKDDPIAPYVIAAIEKAAHTVKDPVTGFTEFREGDRDAADELTDVLLNLLPEDLRGRFAQESAADRERAKKQIQEAIGGMGLGGLFTALGGMGPFAKQATANKAGGLLKGVVENFPDMGDEMNRIIRPDTPAGRKLRDSLSE
jgi:hypothetical protein